MWTLNFLQRTAENIDERGAWRIWRLGACCGEDNMGKLGKKEMLCVRDRPNQIRPINQTHVTGKIKLSPTGPVYGCFAALNFSREVRFPVRHVRLRQSRLWPCGKNPKKWESASRASVRETTVFARFPHVPPASLPLASGASSVATRR